MKRVILMCLLCAGLSVYAQEWAKKINDPDWHSRRSKGLKVGDEMPNLSLGNVYNNKTGKTQFSDFKGKLVILDFWMTWCGSCIAGFPKMERLQKEFGDKVQIILVNPYETIDEVYKVSPNLKLPDLPSIMKDAAGNSKKLLDLFPQSSLGHQVWIDKEGIIRLRGANYNNSSKKIGDFLSGKQVFLLNDISSTPNFDPQYPYVKLLGDFTSTHVGYGSFFTSFNNEYAPEGNGSELVIDTVQGTIRTTYINTPILNLYMSIFSNELKEGAKAKDILYYHNRMSEGVLRFFILPKDTLRYADYLPDRTIQLEAEEWTKSKICYEQIIPLKVSEKQRKSSMRQDLDRYLGNLYNTEVKLEKKVVPCYVLLRTTNKDKLISKVKDRSKSKIIRNGKSLVRYNRNHLNILGTIIRESPLSFFFTQNSKKDEATFLLDETGFDKKKYVDLTLPESRDIKTIDDLRRALQPYDLDIQLTKREIQFVVITDNSGK